MINISTEVVKIGKIQKKVSNNTSQVFHPETEIAQIVDFPETYNNTGKYLTTDGSNLFWNTVNAGDSLPSQTGNSGKYLTTNGTSVSWATVDALPSQTNNAGKYLTTNGTTASWEELFPGEIKISSVHNPSANATTITLTSSQRPDSNVDKYALSVYRDGIHLIDGIDYTYASNSGVLTFTRAFESTELVSVNFSYLTTDGGSSGSGESLPTQTGQSGKFLTTNGTDASWANIPEYTLPVATASTLGGIKVGSGLTITDSVLSADSQIPSQTNNSGKYLTTNGTSVSWGVVDVLPSQTGNSGKVLLTDGTTASWVSLNSTEEIFNVTSSTTTVTLSSATSSTPVTAISVYLDGLRLVNNIDYTYDSTTQVITFNRAFLDGDQVVVYVGPIDYGINNSSSGSSTIEGLPSLANNSGKYLTNNGTNLAWGTPNDTVTTATTTGDGNAVTSITATNGALTVTKGSTFSLSTHNHDGVYAPLASPALTGTPTAPTATAGDNSTQIATTAYVDNAVSALVSSAPATLDTLNELASALGNDPNFATTIATEIGEKLDADSANYVKSLSISGTTITVTKGNDTTSTLTTQDTVYTLPEATDTTLGGVIIGDGLSVTGGTISVDDQLPSQANNSGKFLSTNGTTASWEDIDVIPNQAQNAGKFLTTDGTDLAWSDILNEIKVSSIHYPSVNDTTITLTQAQAIPSTISKYAMSVYRDGIYLNPSIDYGYNTSTRTLTFVKPFKTDEVVNVLFTYVSTDTQAMLNLEVEEYEAGNGITFTNNAVTNKTIISVSDQLPSQTNNSGKFLTTNGSVASWSTVDALPSQTGNSGKLLTTDGSSASWMTPDYLSTTGGTLTGNLYGRPVVGTSATATGDDLPVMFVSRENTLIKGDTPDKARYFTIGVATDSTGTLDNYHKYGQIQVTLASNGMVSTELVAYRNVAGNNSQAKIAINQTTDGVISTTAPTPPANSDDTQIATTEWVNTAITSAVNNVDALPSQTGNSGKYLTTDGSSASWATVDSLPVQNGNSGKFLTTDGSSASWATVDILPSQTGNSGKFLATDGSSPVWVDMALPTQAGNSGKFLTTNGTTTSWANLSDIRISSVHTPSSGATTITLTSGQNIPNDVSAYTLSIYRNGLYMTPTTDYSFNSSTGVITFVDAFVANETVNVIFTYISTDGQSMSQGGGSSNTIEYEAGTGIAFNLNTLTNKTVISTDIHPSEECTINSNASGSISLNIDTTSVYAFLATGNISFSFVKDSTLGIYSTNRSITLTLLIQDGGSYIVSWPNNVYWPNNTAPSLSVDNVDVITLITFDSGATWLGNAATNYTIS